MAGKNKITTAERRHRDRLRQNTLRTAAVYETRLERARRKELRRVLDLARDYWDPIQIVPLLEGQLDETGYLPGWWTGLYTAVGLPHARTTAKELRQAKAAEEEDLWLGTMRRYAQTRAANEIRIVTGTWKDSLVKIVRGILEEDLGRGVEKVTKEIYKRYLSTIEKWQCRRIAQTEAMIGMAEAGDAAAKTLGIHYTKQWVISGLGNTRASHEAMDGVTVDEDEPFVLPGGMMMFPHDTSMNPDPGEIINCACDVLRNPKGYGFDSPYRPVQQSSPAPATAPTPTQMPQPVSPDEQRIQELMKDYADRPEDVQKALAENDLAIEKATGTKKGKPMSIEQADKQNANPNYVAPYIEDPNGIYRDAYGNLLNPNPKHKASDVQNEINCVTCANCYILRQRGHKFTAKGRIAGSGSINDRAAMGFNAYKMWKNADGTEAKPLLIQDWMRKKKYKQMSPKRYNEFYEEACKEKGDYVALVGWGKIDGHATTLHRGNDGKLSRVEPQVYKKKLGVKMKYTELGKIATKKPRSVDGVLRVNDKIFDTSWLDLFNTK